MAARQAKTTAKTAKEPAATKGSAASKVRARATAANARPAPAEKAPAEKAPAKKAEPAKKTDAVKKAASARKPATTAKAAPAKKTAAKAAPAKKTTAKAAPVKAASAKKTTAKPAATAKKTAAKAAPPAKPAPTTERSPATQPEAPAATPSERLLAARAEMPKERSLTDEEREAMAKVSETARRFVGASGGPIEIVGSIASFIEDVRLGKRDEPKSQDVRLGLGVLWGEQLRAQVGWCWVHLTYPDGFASYALVPDDRAFACFPLNRVPEALRSDATNTSAHVFDSIRAGSLPARKASSYLVIG